MSAAARSRPRARTRTRSTSPARARPPISAGPMLRDPGHGAIGLYASAGRRRRRDGSTTTHDLGRRFPRHRPRRLWRQRRRRGLAGQPRRGDDHDIRPRRLRACRERLRVERLGGLDHGVRNAQHQDDERRRDGGRRCRATAPPSWRPAADRSRRRATRSHSSAERTRPRPSTISPSAIRPATSSSPIPRSRPSISTPRPPTPETTTFSTPRGGSSSR